MPTLHGAKMLVDSLLRAAGNSSATLLVCLATGDPADGGQIGLDTQVYQELVITPAVMRRTRATMFAGQQSRYELVLSASCVESYVSDLQLLSAESLFVMSNGVLFAGGRFEIESWASTNIGSGAISYRLLVRAAEAESMV